MRVSELSGFYFYDLETSGRDPRWHRVLQFAGVRTDRALNPLEEPLVLRGRLPEEVLPEVDAMRVTGLTPEVVATGCGEAELADRIAAATGDASLCLCGYNSVRFDDEFLRFTFYRSLLEPYGRERRGGTRMDLLDLVRATRALRPDGMQWPLAHDGLPSSKLVDIAAANGVEHASAHDAGSDVLATIGVARCLRAAQPRLFDYAVSLRQRRVSERLLAPGDEPVVHVSGRIPRDRASLALMTSLGRHPRNARGYLVFDLSQDPREYAGLSEDELYRRLFTPGDALEVERLRMKEIRTNRSPFVAELAAVRSEDALRLGLDVDEAIARHRWLRGRPELVRRLVRAFTRDVFESQPSDADAALYDDLIGDRDQMRALDLRGQITRGERGPNSATLFDDARLRALAGRFRARNAPQTLDPTERSDWQAFVRQRLEGQPETDAAPARPGREQGGVSLARFGAALRIARDEDGDTPLLVSWDHYAAALAARFGLPWPVDARAVVEPGADAGRSHSPVSTGEDSD